MDPIHSPLNGFSTELYIATLSKLAHSDGLHSSERDLFEHYAERFGIDLGNLPDVPEDLTDLPWVTRVLVYRDAVMLCLADEHTSSEEQEHLVDLAERMKLPTETTDSILAWANDYEVLLERFEALIGGRD